MDNLMIHKVNAQTNEVENRPFNDIELAELEASNKLNKEVKEKEAKEAAPILAAKAALLVKLGITEDEAALLLS
jgi:hypothetical protein